MAGRSSSVARRIWSDIPGLYDGLRAGGRILAIEASPCDKCRHSRRLGGRMKRAAILSVVLWGLGAAGIAVAEETTEAAPAAQAQAAPEDQTAEAEAPAESKPVEKSPEQSTASTAPAEAPAPAAAAEPPKPAESAPATAPEPARAEQAEPQKTAEPVKAGQSEPQKAPAAKNPVQAAFQTSWQDASPDEKALFLEAFGETSKTVQERWEKATPDERRRVLRAHPLLGARALKHHWVSATPEERAAFLEASPRTVQKIKDAWEHATPEQRKLLALEHPYFARKAFHHAWTQATPQEKIAFVIAHPALYVELRSKWSGATAAQKQWYAKNYPGIDALASSKAWAEITTEERAAFLEANAVIADKARDAWQRTQPEMRATLARKWQGWPLKAYQARLDSAGKTLVSVKTRPASTKAKGTAKPAVHRQ